MPDFFPTRDGGVRVLLDDIETDLIRRLTDELRALIAADVDRSDDVLGRLFPSTYDDDAEERAYREVVGDGLARHKLDALDAVSSSLGDGDTDIVLDEERFGTWLACLTDLRLAIGTRLEVDEETMSADIDPKHPNAHALSVLHWLGWVQDGLLRAIGGS